MSGQRPKTQLELAFPSEDPGEAPRTVGEGTEPHTANRASQHPVPDMFFADLGVPQLRNMMRT
jgi:hypothetical protein